MADSTEGLLRAKGSQREPIWLGDNDDDLSLNEEDAEVNDLIRQRDVFHPGRHVNAPIEVKDEDDGEDEENLRAEAAFQEEQEEINRLVDLTGDDEQV